MVVTLNRIKRVGWHVFAGDKPGLVFATATLRAFFLHATNAQTLALTQGVKTQTHMASDDAPLFVFDRARFVRNVEA